MAKATSLRQAKSEAQIIDLPRDHYGFQNWSIMTDGFRVWVSKQRAGELLALYERPQTPRRR